MKKNTKLLLGAGAALGIGYLLLRKKDDGTVAGLGAAPSFTPEELAEFDEFDSFYAFESGARTDYGDVLAAIAARRGTRLTEAQQGAAYVAAVAQGMDAKGCGTAMSRCATDAEILSYYGPYILQSLANLGLDGSSGDGGSSGAECPAGTVATGQNADGSLVCTSANIGPGTGSTAKCGGKYHTRSSGQTCGAHCECDGTLLCLDGKCVDAGAGAGGTGSGGTITPGDKKKAEDKQPPSAAPPKKDDGGIGIGTIALALAAGGVVWFLLRTDDTKVVKLRAEGAEKARKVGARAAGAASRKLAEYQRRLANGSGVNGLRRRRKSRR